MAATTTYTQCVPTTRHPTHGQRVRGVRYNSKPDQPRTQHEKMKRSTDCIDRTGKTFSNSSVGNETYKSDVSPVIPTCQTGDRSVNPLTPPSRAPDIQLSTGNTRPNMGRDQHAVPTASSSTVQPQGQDTTQPPNGHTFVSFSSRNMKLSDKAINLSADNGKMDNSGINAGHCGPHKVCIPRKTLKAKPVGGTKPRGNTQLPQPLNLHKMGNNSLFNFGFKPSNLNKQ